jgi:hypothetical protein
MISVTDEWLYAKFLAASVPKRRDPQSLVTATFSMIFFGGIKANTSVPYKPSFPSSFLLIISIFTSQHRLFKPAPAIVITLSSKKIVAKMSVYHYMHTIIPSSSGPTEVPRDTPVVETTELDRPARSQRTEFPTWEQGCLNREASQNPCLLTNELLTVSWARKDKDAWAQKEKQEIIKHKEFDKWQRRGEVFLRRRMEINRERENDPVRKEQIRQFMEMEMERDLLEMSMEGKVETKFNTSWGEWELRYEADTMRRNRVLDTGSERLSVMEKTEDRPELGIEGFKMEYPEMDYSGMDYLEMEYLDGLPRDGRW